jgi:multidrug resistance efflux pump
MEKVNEENEKDEKKKSKKKKFFLIILAMLLLIGTGVGYYLYWESMNYFITDNAKVAADLRTVTSQSSGRLVKLNISEGSFVSENEVIGRLNNGYYLRSPINGQVVKLNVVLNQIISQGTVFVVIADINNIYINANIEETDIVKIKEGQEVTVQLDAYPGEKFRAHIKDVNKVTQAALTGNATSFSTSGTYTKVVQLLPVKITIDDNIKLNGLIGTNAKIKIKIK